MGIVPALERGATAKIDFFTLTATSLLLGESYSIKAGLAFHSLRSHPSEESGGGRFPTFFGITSAGTLNRGPDTIPDTFAVTDGNTIQVDLQSGRTVLCGDTLAMSADITNRGGGISGQEAALQPFRSRAPSFSPAPVLPASTPPAGGQEELATGIFDTRKEDPP